VKNPLSEKDQKHADKYALYDLKYYENEMNIIANIKVPGNDFNEGITFQIGKNILITRKYVTTKS
jgi:hypothetical protein